MADDPGLLFREDAPFFLVAGPCALEDDALNLQVARRLREIGDRHGVPVVFKASYDKANRTSLGSGRGMGLDEGLAILAEVRTTHGCPVITDVHAPDQCAPVASVADALQIPAFLSRQTDLLTAAAATGRPVNVKKGQFLAPWDMGRVAAKLTESGNDNVLLCERGVSFGYNNLVVDMRGLPEMARTGFPVIFDATHSVQQPGGQGGASGGQRAFAPVLARAALSVGVAGVFLETHPDPDTAVSDGPNMIPLKDLPDLLETLLEFDRVAKARPVTLD